MGGKFRIPSSKFQVPGECAAVRGSGTWNLELGTSFPSIPVYIMTLTDKVKKAGVVGAGGGGFPAHVKLGAKADTIIANGAECEPLLHKDAAVMQYFSKQIVQGMLLAMDSV